MDSIQEKQFHALSIEEVAKHLETNLEQGLTDQEAQKRLERFGTNTISHSESSGSP